MSVETRQELKREWLTYHEAVRFSGLGRTTLWKLAKDGEVQAAKIGKAVRFSRQSLHEFMEQRVMTPNQTSG